MRIWAKKSKKPRRKHEELTFFWVFLMTNRKFMQILRHFVLAAKARDVAKVTDMVGRISVEPGTDLVDLPGGSVGL